jgi:hypothetical protein
MERMKSLMPSFALGFIGIGAAVGVMTRAFRSMVSGITEATSRIDSIAKASRKLGLTTEELSRLHHAAEITGVRTQTFDMAIQRMTRRLAEASHGTGEAVKALQELGVDARRLAGASPAQAFSEIAGAIGKVKNQSDRVRLAFKLFDSEGVALVNTLMLGEEGIARLNQEADQLGRTISGTTARAMEELVDAGTRAKAAWEGMANEMADLSAKTRSNWAAIKGAVAGSLRDVLKEWRDFREEYDALRGYPPPGKSTSAATPGPAPAAPGPTAEFTRSLDRASQIFNSLQSPMERYMAKVREVHSLHKQGALSAYELSSVLDALRRSNLQLLEPERQRAAQIMASLATPMERYQAAIAEVNDLHAQAALSTADMHKALKRLGVQYAAVLNPAKKLSKAVTLGPVRLAPSFELGSTSAAQASFRAGSQPAGTEQAVKQLVEHANTAKTKDDRRNDTLARILYAMEHQPVVTMGG